MFQNLQPERCYRSVLGNILKHNQHKMPGHRIHNLMMVKPNETSWSLSFFRMHNPEQPNMYHPRRTVQLSGCTIGSRYTPKVVLFEKLLRNAEFTSALNYRRSRFESVDKSVLRCKKQLSVFFIARCNLVYRMHSKFWCFFRTKIKENLNPNLYLQLWDDAAQQVFIWKF